MLKAAYYNQISTELVILKTPILNHVLLLSFGLVRLEREGGEVITLGGSTFHYRNTFKFVFVYVVSRVNL